MKAPDGARALGLAARGPVPLPSQNDQRAPKVICRAGVTAVAPPNSTVLPEIPTLG